MLRNGYRLHVVTTSILLAVSACGDDGSTSPTPSGAGAGGATTTPAGTGGSAAVAGTGGGAAVAGAGAGSGAAGSAGMSVAGSAGSAAGSGSPGLLEAAIEVKAVPAGAEDHVCVVVALSNDAPVWASELHATLTDGSHHLIVDRRASSSALQADPTSCSPTMGGDDTRLMIAQQHDSLITLPAGVAYQLEPHQRIFLQLHYINLTLNQVDIHGKVAIKLADASAGALKPVHSVFAGAMYIDLQPHQPGSAQYFLQPRAGVDGTPHVFSLTSHTHSLGVHATIERVVGIDAPPTTPIHVSDDWSEPPLTQFSPALDFTGSDGLRLICQYMNDTDRAVRFGTSFNDEMCFMWMYFYLD